MQTSAFTDFVVSALLDGGCDHQPMTPADAEYNLRAWREDPDLAPDLDGITPAQLVSTWNDILKGVGNHA